jgi:hypothetical protein
VHPAVAEANALGFERRNYAMQGTRLGTGDTALESSQVVRQGREIEARSASLLLRQAGEIARGAQHAASNLDNRHVAIVCAELARVNVSVLY